MQDKYLAREGSLTNDSKTTCLGLIGSISFMRILAVFSCNVSIISESVTLVFEFNTFAEILPSSNLTESESIANEEDPG